MGVRTAEVMTTGSLDMVLLEAGVFEGQIIAEMDALPHLLDG
jgi:hypothetical protein